MISCEICGRAFKTAFGLRAHHSLVHVPRTRRAARMFNEIQSADRRQDQPLIGTRTTGCQAAIGRKRDGFLNHNAADRIARTRIRRAEDRGKLTQDEAFDRRIALFPYCGPRPLVWYQCSKNTAPGAILCHNHGGPVMPKEPQMARHRRAPRGPRPIRLERLLKRFLDNHCANADCEGMSTLCECQLCLDTRKEVFA